jgi:Holliday junction resolvase RusA-like endonuclease
VKLFIDVLGTPAPQGSKRAFAIRKGGVPTGRVAVVEQQDKRVKSWRQAVLEAALSAVAKSDGDWSDDREGSPGGPVGLKVIFYLKRPAGHYGSGKNSNKVKPSAPGLPARMPDLSKLIRATEDALTDAGVWADDGQVVVCRAHKVWADARPPGARIDISIIGTEEV